MDITIRKCKLSNHMVQMKAEKTEARRSNVTNNYLGLLNMHGDLLHILQMLDQQRTLFFFSTYSLQRKN